MGYRMNWPGRPMRFVAFALATAATTAAGAAAQSPPVTAAATVRSELTEAERQAALQAIRARLGKAYIYPALAPAILARLDAATARYATGDAAEFAALVTEDLQVASKDTHLYLNFEPEWYAAATGAADPHMRAGANAAELQHARDFNHGWVEQKILPGNVRLAKLVGFFWSGAESAEAYDAGMRFLSKGRAAIIDLRGNRGGDTQALYYLLSHFVAGGATITTVVTPGGRDHIVRSKRNLPAGLLTGLPLYVLVDSRSRSAAEAVAHTVRELKLGEVVGERTEGANHISDDTPIAPGFRLSVPLSYTLDPVSKSNWEGQGVQPTIAVASAEALDTAYADALALLLARTPGGQTRDFLVWARDGLAARRSRYNPLAGELASLAGSYGVASIELRDSALWLHRPDRREVELKPIGAGGLFEAVDDDTLRVRIGGGTLEIFRPGQPGRRFVASTKPPA
ncbi:MAG: S41 family peptidase [Novosphingobium sp.]